MILRNCFLVLFGVIALPVFAGGEEADSELIFARRVSNLFTEKCVACHGGNLDEMEGGLDLRSPETALKGGDSGEPSLVAHSADTSPIFLAATRKHEAWSAMPPKDTEALTKEQLGWLREWIDTGAEWLTPDEVLKVQKAYEKSWLAEDGITVPTSGGLADNWTNRRYKPESLWAYQPVRSPDSVAGLAMSEAIDQLIQQHMPEGLQNAAPADRVTLIRRATFDLLGLPPSVDEIEAFVKDKRDDREAFSLVVERLLASPHYGERMARHWLDVVRYADSSGFANDYDRGNAWRYRDYVVRAFNNDKPYDEFIQEQIAGDEIDPNDSEKLIATGFLRMGPWELTAMEVPKIARQRFLDDVTNSVGETFLAHSLQCARCHDHKFDPIPTKDYYSVQAVFANTQLTDRAAAFLPSENQEGFDEVEYLEMRAAEHHAVVDKLDEVLLANAVEWFKENGKPIEAWSTAVECAKKMDGRRGVFNDARGLLMDEGVAESEFPPKLVGFGPQEFGMERVARKGLERLVWERDRYKPFALAVYNGPNSEKASVTSPMRMPKRIDSKKVEACAILVGGDPFSPSQPVTPGVLSSLAGFAASEEAKQALSLQLPTTPTGRRRSFAAWVASEHNPLTTRTMANRVWMWHFGTPIAGNPNNFGSTGKQPTHPELLDYLAEHLASKKWSIKSLHRGIMLSDAYRRHSSHPDPKALAEKDPLSRSYAVFQPRRLTCDELRDSMLSATGELNPTLGGIPNRPEMNLEAALQPRQVMGTFASAWVPNPLPSQRHRRSLYALKLRGLMDPFYDVFNAPSADFSCERREASTVTPQVFNLFNSRFSYDRALALADRANREAAEKGRVATLGRLIRLSLGRRATDSEIKSCMTFWNASESRLRNKPAKQIDYPTEVVRNAVEENTGEKFSFTERLYANEDFVPDLQASDVSLSTRALADIALVLLNSNEFVYVY
jgi:mono/diheme cytochrome c family protein